MSKWGTRATTLLISVLVLPQSADAARLVPRCADGGFPNTCNFCDLVQLANNLITFVIEIALVIFMVLVAWAGIKLVVSQGNPSALQAAKDQLFNFIIGLIIILSGWLIVDTVMKVLVDEAALGPWNEIECGALLEPQDPDFFDPTFAEYNFPKEYETADDGLVDEVNFSPDPTPPPDDFAAGSVSHDDAVSFLKSVGVVVTSTNDPPIVQPDCTGVTRCTSTENMQSDTVLQVVNIATACGQSACGDIVVTGGTEGGHAGGATSHASGHKVDIDDNPQLDAFLQEKLTRSGTRGGPHGGPRYVDSCGNEYVRESSHWDIKVTEGACEL